MRKLIENKNSTKYRVLNYMLKHGVTTKVELSRELNLSMPTILSNVNEMVENGIIVDAGEMESNGGRKARMLKLQKDYCFSIGVDITAHHIVTVLLDLGGEVLKRERIRENFASDVAYCNRLAEHIRQFYDGVVSEDKILGVGISLPGIINEKERVLEKSHALQLENYSLKTMEELIPFPIYFENDANAAMLAENFDNIENAIYLSLSNTLGGAVYINGGLYTGQYRKAAEFGHTILHPDGKMCYCGKQGCADAYCAASVLTQNGKFPLESFMEQIGTNKNVTEMWQEYLENLAMLISNLRMVFDSDIILGGEIGGYLSDYMMDLREKVVKYNLFDGDTCYLKNCSCKKNASAIGVAKHFFE